MEKQATIPKSATIAQIIVSIHQRVLTNLGPGTDSTAFS
jgi:hypothetical protein